MSLVSWCRKWIASQRLSTAVNALIATPIHVGRPRCPRCGIPFNDWFVWPATINDDYGPRYCWPCYHGDRVVVREGRGAPQGEGTT